MDKIGHIKTRDDGVLEVTFGKYWSVPCLYVHYPYNHNVPYAYSTEWHEYWTYIDELEVYMSNISMI